MSNKERRPMEIKSTDPQLDGYFNPNDRLSLSKDIEDYLKSKDLDFRFLNAPEFRKDGGYHPTQWLPFNAREAAASGLKIDGLTPEGHIQRGDLILGVRPKVLTLQYKEMIRKRNEKYNNFNKSEARRLKEHARASGLGDYVTVVEGYDDKK